MSDAIDRIELLATDGSMYETEVVESGLVDDVRCDTRGDTTHCEVRADHQYTGMTGEFDEVRMDGFDRHTTFNPQNGNDLYMDSFLGYCGVVEVEDQSGQFGDERMLVCVDSDRLSR